MNSTVYLSTPILALCGIVLISTICAAISERKRLKRLREAMHRGDRIDARGILIPTKFPPAYSLRSLPRQRGHALLEALAVTLFCAVIAAAIVACLSDLDLALSVR